MGGWLEARNQGDRLAKRLRFGFATIRTAPSSHRRRKRKPRHLLAVGTKLSDRSAMSPRGPRGTAPMPTGRRRARHLCLGLPSRASTQRGLARAGGADAAPGSPAPARGPGSGRGRLKPPASTARTRRARKLQPRGHFPGAAAAG